MKKKAFGIIAGTFILLFGLTIPAWAATETEDDGWKFILSPMFVWGKSIDGTTGAGPSDTQIDLNFKDDILENLAAVFTVHFEAKKNDWTLFTEYQYVNLDPSVETPSRSVVDIDFTVQTFELGAGYKVASFGSSDLEVLGGGRYTNHDIDASLNPGRLSVDAGDNWWDGFIGLRIFTHITDAWTFVGRGDVGMGESDLVVNISAMVDYRFKDWGSVFAGYKWMDYDYEGEDGRDRYAYDATEQGPLAGLAFYW